MTAKAPLNENGAAFISLPKTLYYPSSKRSTADNKTAVPAFFSQMVRPPSPCDVPQQVGHRSGFLSSSPSLPPPTPLGKGGGQDEGRGSHRVVGEAALIGFTLERLAFTDGGDKSLT